ncbi:13974_t:CDS:2 [Entrophospora sp. SA101]|nr:13974_t:CDS:2 [Entrophospora sp. SA101]
MTTTTTNYAAVVSALQCTNNSLLPNWKRTENCPRFSSVSNSSHVLRSLFNIPNFLRPAVLHIMAPPSDMNVLEFEAYLS